MVGCTNRDGEQALTLEEQSALEQNKATAEIFIDAFYSFDAQKLQSLLAYADETVQAILWYQGWAEGGNYKVLARSDCVAESPYKINCAITVQDDPVLALNTGFNVTDTFHLTFSGTNIAAITTSSNDQPIYFEARQWVEENMPEVISGPCNKQTGNAGDCARAMTAGYQAFYQTRKP